MGKSGPSSRQGPTRRMGSTFFGLVDMGLLGLPSLISYFILFTNNDASDAEAGRFTFNESPIFVPGTTILVVHLTALVVSLLKLQPPLALDGYGLGLGEVFCSVYLVLSFWPLQIEVLVMKLSYFSH